MAKAKKQKPRAISDDQLERLHAKRAEKFGMNRRGACRFDAAEITQMRREYWIEGDKPSEICAAHKCAVSQVHGIVSGKHYGHVPFPPDILALIEEPKPQSAPKSARR